MVSAKMARAQLVSANVASTKVVSAKMACAQIVHKWPVASACGAPGGPAVMPLACSFWPWSLASAYYGVHPEKDPYGRAFTEEDGDWYRRAGSALASGYRLVLWTVKCDLDYVAKGFGLPSHNANKCHLCDCNDTGRPWTATARNPSWLARVWTNAAHAVHYPTRHRPNDRNNIDNKRK